MAENTKPAVAEVAPAEPAPPPVERVVVIPTGVYWIALGLSLLFLFLATGLYSGELEDLIPFLPTGLRWGTVIASLVVVAWSVIGLSRRGRVVHRSVVGTRRLVTGVVEGLQSTGDAHEGAVGRFAAKWTRRIVKLGRAIRWLVLLPWRIVVWAWYTSEKIVWHSVHIGYDLLYYPLYAAWLLAHWAVRTAWRIAFFLLRVAWKVLRLPLYLPIIRKWWRTKKRPQILARINAVKAHRAHLAARRIEKGRRLAQLRGENPDRWEADYRLRRGFPLPHPEKARVRIRRRLAHIRAVQRARREGKPVPRWNPERKKLKDEQRAKREAEAGEAAGAPERKRLGLRLGRREESPESLDFLPETMRERVERVLQDTDVTDEEHENLVAALEDEPSLSDDQKRRARAVIDRWHRQDRRTRTEAAKA